MSLLRVSPEKLEGIEQTLGPEGLGAWKGHGLIDGDLAEKVVTEVHTFGEIEPIRETNSSVKQTFRRMVVDLTKESDFPKLEELGLRLGGFAVANLVKAFPPITSLSFDEAAVQIYPAGTDLGLGWHRDHPKDDLLIISASLTGSGEIVFSSKTPGEARKLGLREAAEEIMKVEPWDVVFFRSTGLYEHKEGVNINPTHAVTRINEGENRFTIQYRMNVNAAEYNNTPVNADQSKYKQRKAFIYPEGFPGKDRGEDED